MDKYHKRMIQDQNTQTSHPNNNISEGLGEQQLDTIAGGCLYCGVISSKAKKGAEVSFDGVKAAMLSDDKAAALNYKFRALKKEAYKSADQSPDVCAKYGGHKDTLGSLNHDLRFSTPNLYLP